MRTNRAVAHAPITTRQGGPAVRINAEQALRRTVMSCLLWEKTFYSDGKDIADRIAELVAQVKPQKAAEIAIEARTVHGLRHAPLLILAELARLQSGNSLVRETVEQVLLRADEPGELLALYWRDNPKAPLDKGLKKGIADALKRFDEYQFAKYNRATRYPLRLVMEMTRPKPTSDAQAALFGRVMSGTLAVPDTWEVALSAGADKKAVFTRLLKERKMGYFAVLRNLRNMHMAGVDRGLVKDVLLARKGAGGIEPFRFIAAARAVPAWEAIIDEAMISAIDDIAPLSGRTIVLVDVSGSMDARLSSKSDLTRMDAAAGLAAIIPAKDLRVITFSNRVVEVPARRGMAGIDVIVRSQAHVGTYLGAAVHLVNAEPHDRLIVISDEQSQDAVPAPVAPHAYMINVSTERNGVGYRNGWTHIDGFSESVLRWIPVHETIDA